MTNEEDPKWFLQAIRNRIIDIEDEKLLLEVTQAIGERRSKDLLDLIAGIEQVKDWKTAAKILVDASCRHYETPFILQNKYRKLESLKYREIIFELFSCQGLEPIPENTTSLLQNVEDKSSFAEATTAFEEYTLNQAIEEVSENNTLFFEFPHHQALSEEHRLLIEERTNQELVSLQLSSVNGEVNISPLWHTNYGREALSELGIRGYIIDFDEFEIVLSVLQTTDSTKKRIREEMQRVKKAEPEKQEKRISNPEYSKLLNSLIEQDPETIRLQGSKHAVPILNALLSKALSEYESSESSSNYRRIVECLSDHTLIRSIDSLVVYEKLANISDLRISTLAISAVGNYYHNSATAVLIDLICATQEKWLIQASIEALRNQIKKYPEAKFCIIAAINSSCRNANHLKKLIRQYDIK